MSKTIGEATTAELLDAVILRAQEQAEATRGGHAGREFSLAATAAEDAQMRWTRGVAKRDGEFAPADLERAEA